MRTILLSGLLLALAVSAPAAEVSQINTTIPFAFKAGDRDFPSGEYSLNINPQSGQVAIKGRRGGATVLRAGNLNFEGDVYQAAQRYEILLNRYDDQYFLSQVWIKNYGMEVAKSAAEKAREDGGQQPRVLKLKVKAR